MTTCSLKDIGNTRSFMKSLLVSILFTSYTFVCYGLKLHKFFYGLAPKMEVNLQYVRIFFDTPTFDRITKDRAAKFVDMMSAIGGTMGLLTGFSIISGVEIIYFAAKIVFNLITKRK